MKIKVTIATLLVFLAVVFATMLHARSRGAQQQLARGTTADRIVVDKSERTLRLFQRGRELKIYRVALGRNPDGPKERQGDGRTPEGEYRIDSRNAQSAFHRSLHISYPTPAQRREAARRGVSAGGDIMIHGLPNGLGFAGSLHLTRDWTEGCIAVTDSEIEELWRVVPNGTVVEIRP
jgi:murein L,D-transpeptidase YafK